MANNQTVMNYQIGRDFARHADDDDELREFRQAFVFPPSRNERDCVYLCGNSLGLQPKLAVRYVEEELAEWARLGVRGHFQAKRPWLSYHRNTRQGLAELTGAKKHEVVAMNSLTVNLHLMMSSFYRPTSGRRKILIESTAFPSDRFAVESQLRMRGFDATLDLIEWSPRLGENDLLIDDLQSILQQQGDEIALMLLPGVQYYNGQLLDMQKICQLAREYGCAVGLDLAHAIGNVPMRLSEWDPDFAAWCSYKYLNAGPGAIGGAFVPERHHVDAAHTHLLGWWGHDEETRMKMSSTFSPAKGVDQWQLSCPTVLSLAPLLASLELFQQADISRLRRKSLKLTGYLDFLLREEFSGRATSITPDVARGAQISMTIVDPAANPREVFERLQSQNVVLDWREPNVIRVAPAPLYNNYTDIYEFARRLRIALSSQQI